MTEREDLIRRLEACELEYVEGQPIGLGAPVNPDGPEAANVICRLWEALEYYADRDGAGKDWVICPRGKYDPIQTVHDMGHRARTVLARLDAAAGGESDHD